MTDHEHDHDHDHGEHDHDHGEHDHEHAEPTEEEMAQAEADVERMSAALAALGDDGLRAGLAGMSERSRNELAGNLNLPRATVRLGDALVPLVRRKLRNASADRQLQVAFALTERVNDDTISALGDNSENPSLDDLTAVLPGVLDAHDVQLVTLMLAAYAASDAEVRPVARELLDTDERFTIGKPVEIEEAASPLAQPPVVDEKALAAKREQRKAAKEAKKAAEQRARAAREAAQAARRAKVHQAKRKAR